MKSILMLSRPTKGDTEFYKRWERIAPVDIGKASNDNNIFCIVTDQYTPIGLDHIKKYPNLEYVISPTTGETHLDNYDLINNAIKVLTLRGETDFLNSITSVAEHTLFLLMQLTKITLAQPMKLSGKSMAIIGFGRVGKQVCKIASALGMDVRGYDKGMSRNYLEVLFKESDVVSIHLSENEETRGMIDYNLLSLMKQDSIFLNTSRASIVDNTALYDLLFNNKIMLAGVDVWDGPDQMLPNLIVTNHVGGRSYEDRIATDNFMVSKLVMHLHNNRKD